MRSPPRALLVLVAFASAGEALAQPEERVTQPLEPRRHRHVWHKNGAPLKDIEFTYSGRIAHGAQDVQVSVSAEVQYHLRETGGVATEIAFSGADWPMNRVEVTYADGTTAAEEGSFFKNGVTVTFPARGPVTRVTVHGALVSYAWSVEWRLAQARLPTVTRAGLVRMDPETALLDLVPLQFFRVAAELDGDVPAELRKTAVLRNPRTGATLDVALTLARLPGGPHLLSEPVLLGVPDTPNDVPQLAACPGDTLELSVDSARATAVVRPGDTTFDPDPCAPPPPPERFALQAVGATTRTFDPASDPRSAPLEVLLLDEAGAPLPDEEVVWQLRQTGEAYATTTDAEGRARLDFAVVERGRFVAVAEGVPLGEPLVDRVRRPQDPPFYDVDVAPLDPIIALGVAAPVAFQVELVRPNAIELFTRGGRLEHLLHEQRFFIRVWPGRRIRDRTRPLDVELATSAGDRLTVALPRTDGGVFESTTPLYLANGANHADLRLDAGANPRGQLRVTALDVTLAVRAYPTELDYRYEEGRDMLALVEDALEAAVAAPDLTPEEQANLRDRLALVGQANRWARARLSTSYKAALVYTYLGLVALEAGGLGEAVDESVNAAADAYHRAHPGWHPFPISVRETAPPAIRFGFEVERDRVIHAFALTRSANFAVVLAAVQGLFPELTWRALLHGLREVVVAPGLAAYTAITGWTADGEVATSMQRFVGGVEALLGLVVLAETAVALAALGRSAQALLQRFRAGRAASRGLELDAAALGEGLTVARQEAVEALEAAQAAQRRERTRQRYTAKVDRANAQLDELRQRRAELQGGRQALVDELAAKERDLAARVARGETRNKGRQAAIGVARRKLQRLEGRMAKLDQRIAKRRARKLRAYQALGNIERLGLSRAEVEALIQARRLPDPFDRVADTFVHKLYEDQVTGALPGFSKGKGVVVRTSHPSVLGDAFGEPLTQPRRQHRTARPVPDHVNETTLDMADSKFYDFDTRTSDTYRRAAAREIAETVEKARLVQRERVRARRRANDLPVDGPDGEDLVNQVVYQRQVTIVTPTTVPPEVQAMIRLLVGKRSASQLRFRVIAPDLAGWAARSRF
jgi:hypothetical protein